MSAETLTRPQEDQEAQQQLSYAEQLNDPAAMMDKRKEMNGNGTNGAEFDAYAPTAQPSMAPEAVVDPASFGQMEQVTYSTGAKHVYGVDEAGKKRHLSHDAVLESHGYGDRKEEQAKLDEAQEKARVDAIMAEAVAKATPGMVKTAKAMMGGIDAKAQPEAEEAPKVDGVYGLKSKDLVNGGLDLVGPNPSKEAVLVTPDSETGYDGPVPKGMEIELAPKAELVPVEAQSDNLPAIPETNGDNLPVLAELDAIENVDEALAAQEKLGLKDRLHNRWMSIKARASLLAQGDVKGALGDSEGKLMNKKRFIGAAAVAGVGALFYANNKYGWGIDINPLDGDGLDLNPFNNNSDATVVETGGTPVPFGETEAVPQGWTDTVNSGDGLTNSIMDYAGQHNTPVNPERAFDIFNQLKAEGLIDPSNVTGSTPMDVVGNVGYSGPGQSTWSPEVIERMNQLLGIQ